MPMKAVIAAYFALVVVVFTAAILVLGVHHMQESQLKAFDNAYLAKP
jgi:hypothetical protein